MRAPRLVGSEYERFWPKVNREGPVPEYRPDLGPCWLWTAGLRYDGYGAFRTSDARTVRAHRWAWVDIKGPIPDGTELDHLCRVRCCVRPDHLEAVTHQVNTQRGLPGGRSWRKAITHCPQGHPYDAANTYVRRTGSRACRACANERRSKYRR